MSGRVLRAEQLVTQARAITRELDALTEAIALKGWERRSIIKTLIEQHGWSQHEVARQLGISQPRVRAIMEDV